MGNAAPVGRFAPTPSGRMHLGNVFAAMIAWLSIRSRGGEMVLRMEDLDTQRTDAAKAELLRQDLAWLGLTYDRETECQSRRSSVYLRYFQQLQQQGLLYPCYCSRTQLHSVNAPHLSDGTYLYPGTCRNLTEAPPDRSAAWRLKVPDRTIELHDLLQGRYIQNLQKECGDFVLRRSDGLFVYQLAVVIDDAEAGVTEVVRGTDLLSSAPRQMYLQELLGFPHPQYGHVPLLLSGDGRRLSKRDRDLDLGVLQQHTSAEKILGSLAFACGLIPKEEAVSAMELVAEFSWSKLRKDPIIPEASRLLSP